MFLSALHSFSMPHRGDQKREYERQLQEEVESLKARTALEIEQIKTHTREMFERENRSKVECVFTSVLCPLFCIV